MIRVVTQPLGLPQQKTAPRATPGHPMPGNANLFFSARLGFKCHPLPSLSFSPSPSFPFARSVCASLTRSATLSAYIAFYDHPHLLPTPYAARSLFFPRANSGSVTTLPSRRRPLFLSLRLIRYIVARPWPGGRERG